MNPSSDSQDEFLARRFRELREADAAAAPTFAEVRRSSSPAGRVDRRDRDGRSGWSGRASQGSARRRWALVGLGFAGLGAVAAAVVVLLFARVSPENHATPTDAAAMARLAALDPGSWATPTDALLAEGGDDGAIGPTTEELAREINALLAP